MKLVTVSVAPPGPPPVTLITISANFNSKMIRRTTAVTLTGNMIGNDMCQNDCHVVAPSTLADSSTSTGSACNPASNKTIMNGIEYQASIAMIERRALQAVAKKAGV